MTKTSNEMRQLLLLLLILIQLPTSFQLNRTSFSLSNSPSTLNPQRSEKDRNAYNEVKKNFRRQCTKPGGGGEQEEATTSCECFEREEILIFDGVEATVEYEDPPSNHKLRCADCVTTTSAAVSASKCTTIVPYYTLIEVKITKLACTRGNCQQKCTEITSSSTTCSSTTSASTQCTNRPSKCTKMVSHYTFIRVNVTKPSPRPKACCYTSGPIRCSSRCTKIVSYDTVIKVYCTKCHCPSTCPSTCPVPKFPSLPPIFIFPAYFQTHKCYHTSGGECACSCKSDHRFKTSNFSCGVNSSMVDNGQSKTNGECGPSSKTNGESGPIDDSGRICSSRVNGQSNFNGNGGQLIVNGQSNINDECGLSKANKINGLSNYNEKSCGQSKTNEDHSGNNDGQSMDKEKPIYYCPICKSKVISMNFQSDEPRDEEPIDLRHHQCNGHGNDQPNEDDWPSSTERRCSVYESRVTSSTCYLDSLCATETNCSNCNLKVLSAKNQCDELILRSKIDNFLHRYNKNHLKTDNKSRCNKSKHHFCCKLRKIVGNCPNCGFKLGGGGRGLSSTTQRTSTEYVDTPRAWMTPDEAETWMTTEDPEAWMTTAMKRKKEVTTLGGKSSGVQLPVTTKMTSTGGNVVVDGAEVSTASAKKCKKKVDAGKIAPETTWSKVIRGFRVGQRSRKKTKFPSWWTCTVNHA